MQASLLSRRQAAHARLVDYSLPELWHLLSLDAPAIAVLWTYFLARCSQVVLPWQCATALFVAVWMLYAADRLLDARPVTDAAPTELQERHRFHWRHRRLFLPALLVCALALLGFLPQLDAQILRLYGVLAVGLAGWLLLVHLGRRKVSGRSLRLPKEWVVGPFFALAAGIPALARVPGLLWQVAPFAALFAAVCTLNCLLLYAWEHAAAGFEAPELPDRGSEAHAFTRWASLHMPALALLVLLASGCLASVTSSRSAGSALPMHLAVFALACEAAALALLLLHTHHDRMRPLVLRVAADAALLTPLLFLPFLR